MSPLSHASNLLAWFTGSTENSHLLKRSIVRFRRRARKVSFFFRFGLFTDLKLSTCFLIDSRGGGVLEWSLSEPN